MAETKQTKGTAGSCVVKRCGCENAYQDEVYGKGSRLHNPSSKGPRCTVCGHQKSKDEKPAS